MNNQVGLLLGDQPRYQRLIGDVADDEVRLRVNRIFVTCRELVEDDDLFARIDERKDKMASDVARAARDQYRHQRPAAAALCCPCCTVIGFSVSCVTIRSMVNSGRCFNSMYMRPTYSPSSPNNMSWALPRISMIVVRLVQPSTTCPVAQLPSV